MLLKVVLLLSVTAALGITPDELQLALSVVSSNIRAHQRSASQEIRTMLVPLQIYANDAKQTFIRQFIPAAQPYWQEIEELEIRAGHLDTDYSACIKPGNEKLYALNNTFANEANIYFDKLVQDGRDEADEAFVIAANTLQDLDVIAKKVADCSDETCATLLEGELTEFYEKTSNTLNDVVSKMKNYVLYYLPDALDIYKLDVEKYQASYAPILEEINACINNGTFVNV